MFRVLLSTFFAFVIVLSPSKAEEPHKFTDGVSAFTCENEYQNFSFIILQRANHFHVVQNGKRLDADINPIEDGYYFEYLAGGNAYFDKFSRTSGTSERCFQMVLLNMSARH